jgi:hypothetical protein
MADAVSSMTATKKRRVRIAELDSIGSVASEMRSVYRRVRHGDITPTFGRILVSILTDIRNCIEAREIEQRLEAIESYIKATDTSEPWKPRIVS